MKPLIFAFEAFGGGFTKARRELLFEKFSIDNLNISYEPVFSDKIINRLIKKYDYFVLGSDQIWHPFVNTTPNLFFATFAKPEQIIYFAPSFGVNELPSNYEKKVIEGLKNENNISVREEEGSIIIKELLGKTATVLLDPTLMLNDAEWKSIAKKPKHFVKGNYILKLFLGPTSDEYNQVIKEYQRNTGLPVFSLADKSFKEGFITGPSEFIYCIKIVINFHRIF